MRKYLLLLCCLFVSPSLFAVCQKERVQLQILGSGGPELTDRRASTSYLLSLDGNALALIDTGSGSALNFEKSGARLNDLKFVLFSHLHVDHSADFVAFLKAFYFSRRDNDLFVYGPEGNQAMPGTIEFINGLAGSEGIYRYLAEYVDKRTPSRFKVLPKNIAIDEKTSKEVYRDKQVSLSATPVHHGPIPTLAWRIELAGCAVTFSGDMNNQYRTLNRLAKYSDILVAHNAIPETLVGVGRQLHMPPSEIGKIAVQAQVKKLILSHRMMRTLGDENKTMRIIRQYYQGPIEFADDLDRFSP
ncbi:MBL fold metallo-hydrolase [Methylomarinum vadi]|uniref:MBL fold metallo-hydrolase n=1 Tax=Methylomarinum vadi TaxID=438855 RepID=UPI00056B3ACA|nr:MBL fold metallo-hydrolase [Methylomarinum vadi]